MLAQLTPGGFSHNEQSLRVVDVLEPLNLTYEVRDGILCHSGGHAAETLEGQVVAVSDRIDLLCQRQLVHEPLPSSTVCCRMC